MKNRIPTEMVKSRSRKMTMIAQNITTEKNKTYKGKTLKVLITSKGTPGSVLSRADNYKPVIIKQSLPLGTFQEVEITDTTTGYLIGTLK